MKTLALSAALLVLFAVGTAWGEDDIPREGARWQLGMEHGPLRIVTVPGDNGQKVTYHYMTMKITNPGTLARDWHPSAKAITDTGRVRTAMGYEHALSAVQAQEGNNDLVPIGAASGKIGAGETLDTVAIFGPLDPLYDRVRIQLLGLSDPIAMYRLERYAVPVELPKDIAYFVATGDGEYEMITEGVTIQDVAYVQRNAMVEKLMKKELGSGEVPEPTPEYWEVSERRVFEMIYTRTGDEFRPDDDLISFERERWTVVGNVKALRKIKM